MTRINTIAPTTATGRAKEGVQLGGGGLPFRA